ncbi:MAG: CAP domain-containing protein [Spirochaetales bacterium]|nr:CAP domain-containing protein [Spirochaetales bacterium]
MRTLIFLAYLGMTASLLAWDVADYEKHSVTSFFKLEEVNSRIDFEKIDYPLLNAAVFYETNRMRKAHRLSEFSHSPGLERAAFGHSMDMVKRKFFSHNSPVRGKETMGKRLALEGIDTGFRGENIATSFGIEYEAGKSVFGPDQNGGYFSYTHKGDPIENHTYAGLARAVVKQWMDSPGHRANILNPKFTFLGTGGYHFQKREFFNMDNFQFTQNFASVKGPAN